MVKAEEWRRFWTRLVYTEDKTVLAFELVEEKLKETLEEYDIVKAEWDRRKRMYLDENKGKKVEGKEPAAVEFISKLDLEVLVATSPCCQ